MRKVAVWGFVVVAVALLFTGAQAQRITLAPTVAPTKPSQVEVTNFPAVQEVTGTVSISNSSSTVWSVFAAAIPRKAA